MRNKNTAVYINSLESLRAEKWALKSRLRQREQDFEERLSQLPVEVIKATVGRVIPFFLNRRVAAMSWMVVKGVTGIVFRKRGAGGGRAAIFSAIKDWGLSTLAKKASGLFNK